MSYQVRSSSSNAPTGPNAAEAHLHAIDYFADENNGSVVQEGGFIVQIQTIRQRLLETVQSEVLPRLRNTDLWQMVFADTPFLLPPGVTLDLHPGKPLSPQDADPAYSSDLTHNWVRHMLQSSRFPCLGFVLEGSIDWRIGITTRMSKSGGRELLRSEYAMLGIPKSSFFMMPPGVPYSEGDFPYWERSMSEGKPVKVLWIQFHRFGMQTYLSYTAGEKMILDSACYVADSRTLFAAETLIEELSLGKNCSKDIVQTLLHFCLQRFDRGMQDTLTEEVESVVPTSFTQSSATEIVEQACLYIESQYDRKVTLESIATHVYISPSHLARLFQAEKGISITEYITRFRIEYVCTLLAKTDLRINHIGKISGYRNPSYLCQIFQKRMGCSPQQYRNDAITKPKVK
jgi:AraC-like DNA-binding protein